MKELKQAKVNVVERLKNRLDKMEEIFYMKTGLW